MCYIDNNVNMFIYGYIFVYLWELVAVFIM